LVSPLWTSYLRLNALPDEVKEIQIKVPVSAFKG
jgi:hypothetical protein